MSSDHALNSHVLLVKYMPKYRPLLHVLFLFDFANILRAFSKIITFRYNGEAGCNGFKVSTANVLKEWQRP